MRTLNSKEEIYSNMSYVEYFNNKVRGYTKDVDNLQKFDHFCKLSEEESANVKERMLMRKNRYPFSKNVIYVHIPFCLSRCDYCPYYVLPYSKTVVDEYIELLEEEIAKLKETEYIKSTVFQCLYFGGGTPSVMSANQIRHICKLLFTAFQFEPNGEFTFESNPATLTDEKIDALKECGMNRVSLGVQTFHNSLLKQMHCAHTSEKAIELVDKLTANGFLVNIDLIYGLIGQSYKQLQADLEQVGTLKGLQHVTYFPLRIIDGTNLDKLLYENDKISLEEHNTKLLEYDALIESSLKVHGYEREDLPMHYHKTGISEHQYISTATRVIGVGVGAGSMFDYGEFANVNSFEDYKASIKNNQFGINVAAPLTMEQVYERYILFCIIYMKRSQANFETVLKYSFERYFNLKIENRYEKVIEDLKKYRFITISSDEKIVFSTRMRHLIKQVKIGMPSID